MELLFEFLVEILVGGSLEGVIEPDLPKGIRIGLLIFSTLLYMLFSVFFVWLLITSESIVLKLLSGVIVLFIIGVFIFLWHKTIVAKK